MGTTATTAPKLSKSDQALVEAAQGYGLDVDPANFDSEALASAVEICDMVAHDDEDKAIEKHGEQLVRDTLDRAENLHQLGETDPPAPSLVEILKGAKVGQRGLDAAADLMPGSPSERSDELANAGATPEQAQRAANAAKEKAGLRGAALARWIITGESGKQQTEKARAERGATESKPARAKGEPREGSTMHACITVLRAARKPLKASEVYEKIKAQNLAPGLKGKTPEATVAAQLNVATAKGQHGIHRPKPGHFAITKGS